MVAGIGYRLCFWLGAGGLAAFVAAGMTSQWVATGAPPSLEQHPLVRALGEIPEADVAARLAEHRAYAAIQPRDAKAAMKLGTALANSGDDAGAIRAFEAAASMSPVPPAAHSNLATLYHRHGRIEEARVQARLALERGAPVNPQLRRQLGLEGSRR